VTRAGNAMFLVMVAAVSAMLGIALVLGAADLLVNIR
jgi:hypothetical protein